MGSGVGRAARHRKRREGRSRMVSISLPAGRGEPADVRCPVRRRGPPNQSPRAAGIAARGPARASHSPLPRRAPCPRSLTRESNRRRHRRANRIAGSAWSRFTRPVNREPFYATLSSPCGRDRKELHAAGSGKNAATIARHALLGWRPSNRPRGEHFTFHSPVSSFGVKRSTSVAFLIRNLESSRRRIAAPRPSIRPTPRGEAEALGGNQHGHFPVPAQPVIPAPSASAMSHQSRPHRMCDPLIRELNRFRGLAELSK